MRSGFLKVIIIVLTVFAMIDVYFHWTIYRLFFIESPLSIFHIYQVINVLPFAYIAIKVLSIILSYQKKPDPAQFSRIYSFTGIILFFYLPKILFIPFILLSDLSVLVTGFFIKSLEILSVIRLIILSPGMLVSGVAIILIPIGIFFGRFNFRMRNFTFKDPSLPDQFDGMRIMQISDLHTGSLEKHASRFVRLIKKINDQKPDIILFTGDMVNNFAAELKDWVEILSKLEAAEGKYSILGNHDYGEYFDWKDEEAWQSNMAQLKEYEQQMGFQLLLNDSVPIKRNGQFIWLIGVENWGLPPFKQYGNLEKAMARVNGDEFTILMTHDPSHWRAEVVARTRINLTLSGHTHGMQFGIRLGRFQWSPISLKYPEWAGWYQEGNQHLHVSTGLGYIGFPVRIGVPPEVVIIELKTS